MMNNRIKYTALLFFLFSITLNSQTRDSELWSGIDIVIPFTKSFEAEIAKQVRFYHNIEQLKWNITDFGLRYRINKNFKFSSTYRYRAGKDEYQYNLYINAYAEKKIDAFRVNYRLRYYKKFRYEKINNVFERLRDTEYIRHKLILKYDTDTRFRPFFGGEIFYLINNEKYSDRFDVFRVYLGCDIKTFIRQDLTLYLMYEEEFNRENSDISSVIGVFYSFELKKLF